MAKKTTPMHQPPGAPGNLNDVAELRQMLANQTAIAEAARDHVAMLEAMRETDQKEINDLKAQIDEIESKAKSYESEIEEIEGERDDAQAEADDAHARISELEEELLCKDDDARDLAAVRRMIKGGAPQAADELTRILDRSFDTWKHYA